MVDLEYLVNNYPNKILIGNMNSHILAAGPLERITDEVHRCLKVGVRAPQFVLNVGGQITHDISTAHLEHYLQVRKQLSRELVAQTPAF